MTILIPLFQLALAVELSTPTSPEAQRYALDRLASEPQGAADIDALAARIEQNDADRMVRVAAMKVRFTRAPRSTTPAPAPGPRPTPGPASAPATGP